MEVSELPTRKDVTVWITGYLTFLSVLFTFDAFFFFGGPNSLLKLYPIYAIIQSIFGNIDASTYLWLTSISTFILFGITSTFVFQDPLTLLLKKLASESQTEECQVNDLYGASSNLSMLEMIDQSLTRLNIDMNDVKKILSDLKDGMETTKIVMTRLTAKVASLERGSLKMAELASDKDEGSTRFDLCPYCGKELTVIKEHLH